MTRCRETGRSHIGMVAGLAVAVLLPEMARAGNGANYVLYNERTEEKGETEVKLYGDFSDGGDGERSYAAQLLEIEHGVTDYWTAALYFEGDKIDGENYAFGGWRFENRLRLFEYGTFLNPVLYAEYEQLEPEHRYVRVVTGRTDEEEDEERTEYELETRLILAQDLTDRFNLAFNWINETNLKSGKWEFGYATGLNYVLFKEEGSEEEHESRSSSNWGVEKLLLGVELYGGLGDATLGLTLDPGKTKQYLGVNLLAKLENHIAIGIGGAFGLTEHSEDALLRLQVGYEIE